jgi:hypothetical protein
LLLVIALSLAGVVTLWLLRARPRRPAEVVSEASFSSARLPAIELRAPPGWRLAHDAGDGSVTATFDPDPDRRTPIIFVVRTSRLPEPVDARRVAAEMTAPLAQRGWAAAPPADATLAGAPALTYVQTQGDRRIATWIVKRAEHLLSFAQCISEGSPPAPQACQPITERLRWREPAPM